MSDDDSKKENGFDFDMEDDSEKIIYFPEMKERKRLRKDKQNEDRAQEVRWRALYRQREKSERVPFFNLEKLPPFTRFVAAAILFIHVVLILFFDEDQRTRVYYMFGFTPGSYTGTLEWRLLDIVTPFTSLWIHGGWMHLAFNLAMLLAMGVMFERNFGWRRTALFFVLCGLCGNLVYFLFSPFSLKPVIGASGAISGLFAVVFLLFQDRISSRAGSKAIPGFLIFWVVLIVGTGLVAGDVAWQTHLGGFFSGLAIYYLWKRKLFR